MALIAQDEYRHLRGPQSTWQENYFFLGWSEEQAAGFLVHLAHVPARGEVEAKAMIRVGDRIASATRHHHADECLAIDGLDVDFAQPFERLRLNFSELGTIADETDPSPWLVDHPGEVPFGLNLELRNPLPPVDWMTGKGSAHLADDNLVVDHYEVASTWTGELFVEDRSVTASGLSVRDHSWGPRDFAHLDLAWWHPIVLDEGNLFYSGVSVCKKGIWTSFLLRADAGGVTLLDDPWIRIGGRPEPSAFNSAQLMTGWADGSPKIFEFERRLHVPSGYPNMADGHLMNDMLSVVRHGEMVGFGVMELNRR